MGLIIIVSWSDCFSQAPEAEADRVRAGKEEVEDNERETEGKLIEHSSGDSACQIRALGARSGDKAKLGHCKF